jgi:hypothetical protein
MQKLCEIRLNISRMKRTLSNTCFTATEYLQRLQRLEQNTLQTCHRELVPLAARIAVYFLQVAAIHKICDYSQTPVYALNA